MGKTEIPKIMGLQLEINGVQKTIAQFIICLPTLSQAFKAIWTAIIQTIQNISILKLTRQVFELEILRNNLILGLIKFQYLINLCNFNLIYINFFIGF